MLKRCIFPSAKVGYIEVVREITNDFFHDDSIRLGCYGTNKLYCLALSKDNQPLTQVYNVEFLYSKYMRLFINKNDLYGYYKPSKKSKRLVTDFPFDDAERILFLFYSDDEYVTHDFLILDD